MKLVGKKLYRVGPLKCFKGGGGPSGGPSEFGKSLAGVFGGFKKKGPTPEELRMQEWEKEAKRDLYDPEQKRLYDKRLALADKVGSGEAAREGARIGAEAGLKSQMAAAGAGRGSAAARMRGLARAQEAGVRGVAEAGAKAKQAATGQQFGMLGQAGQGRFGMQKSDKAGRLGYYQKRRGLEVAEKAAKEQAAAARSASTCCVHPDTQIAMADGTSKKAKDVRLGDILKTQAGEGAVEVISNPTLGHRSLYSYGRGSFFITGEHPIHANGEWKSLHIENSKINYGVECKLLQVGDVLTLINGDSVRLEKIEGEANDFDLVLYDFHLGGNEDADHTYYANGLLVHNGGCAGGGEILDKYKRKNGKIEGPGTETSDDIPAMLSDGEFVVNAKTVRGIGEAMGAKGKQARQVGSGFLYDLQRKYGDKKPVEKFLGGMQLAELGAHAAKKGLMGKKMKGVGEVAGAALDVKKGVDKKKSDLETKEADVHQKAGARETEHHTEYAKGGDVKLGKGVKAKRKYREAIGWESDKIFDKKAEKDYKEGHTGYKNYKGEKSVTPVKMGLGGFLKKVGKIGLGAAKGFIMSGGNPAGAAMGAGKGVMDVAAEDKQKAQAKKQAVAEATIAGAEKKKEAAQGLQEEVQLKKGGAVKKDHPHYKYLKDLDKFMAHAFPKGKKVDLDPGRKADKAIRAKKGSIKPIGMQEGGSKERAELIAYLDKYLPSYKNMLKVDKLSTEKLKELAEGPGREREIKDAKKKFHKREKPELLEVAKEKILEQKKEMDSPEFKEIRKLQKKGKQLEKDERVKKLADNLRKARQKEKFNLETQEAKKKFNVREKPEFLDVAKEKLLEKRKKMESDPDFKEIKEAQKKGKSLEQIERIEGFRKRQKKRRELREAKKKFNVRERPESMDVAEEKFKEEEKKFRSPEYQEMLKLEKKGKTLENKEKQAKDVERIKAFAKRRKAARAAAQVKADNAAADKLVEKGRRETKSILAKPKEVKKEKSWWGDMPDKDKAGIIFGAGKGLLDARKAHLKEKQRRKELLAKGLATAAGTRAAAGNQLIAAPVSLRKGGRVSFKDVLKAKKKMGY